MNINKNATLMTMTLEHRGPTDNDGNGHFTIDFWLVLKVDTGSEVGIGRSHAATVVVDRDTLSEAKEAAEAIQREGEAIFLGMDCAKAVQNFQKIMTGIGKTYEFRPLA